MARKPASHRNPWSKRDLQALRAAPRQGKSQAEVARALGRTPAAIQQKAFAEDIKFRRGVKR